MWTFNNALFAFAAVFVAVACGASVPYSAVCDKAFCRIVDDGLKEVAMLTSSVDEGTCIDQFGQKADQICNTALERFSQEAPLPDDNKDNEALYDKKIEDLEKLLDSPLHVLYMKQLSLIRERAMKVFKQALNKADGTEFEAMMQADEVFRREAEEATRQSPDWSYARDVQGLKNTLQELASRSRKITEVKTQAAKQTQQAMQYLQMQQQQLQAIQQQMQGAYSPWNAAMAYRVPDSNINLSCSYQQGRGNIQISCVPDEAVPLLGPNGFVNGVTPGNIGLSFNINL